MPDDRRRLLAAIMFSDVAGYTALMQEDEERARVARDRHREVLGARASEHEGEVLEHVGDGSLSMFQSAIEAVQCALDVQRDLGEQPRVSLRIGIHTGDVVREVGGIFGDGVNVASRIHGLCPPGGVVVSERVYDDLKNQSGVSARSLGHFSLKNVRLPLEVFAVEGAGAGGPEEGTGLNAIAVLPFRNMSADPENEFFSDGVAEEIINALTRLPGLKVTARTSSFQFKGKDADIRDIGKRLGVGSVLEGSVRRAGKRVRITAQLIEARTGYHLFSEEYDRVLEDIFETQDEIALLVAEKLEATLPSGSHTLVPSRTEDPVAYRLYLQGRHFFRKWTPEAAERASQYYLQAIDRAPDFARAHAGLSLCYSYLCTNGGMPKDEGLRLAMASASRAIRLDDASDESHVALATVRMWVQWDFEAAREAYLRALEINPGNAELHRYFAYYLRVAGHPDEAVERLENAEELDPLSHNVINALGNAYAVVGRMADAKERYERVLHIDAAYLPTLEAIGWWHLKAGDATAAARSFRDLRSRAPTRVSAIGALGFVQAIQGDEAAAREGLEMLLGWSQKSGTRPHTEIARVYAGLGELDETFRHLAAAIDIHDPGVLFAGRSIKPWADAPSDPRWPEVLGRLGRPTA